MYLSDYECDRCPFVATAYFGRVGYYLVEDTTRIPAMSTPAWCDGCGTIVSMEELIDPWKTKQSLDHLELNGATEFDIEWAGVMSTSLEEFVATRKRNLQLALKLAFSRHSLPRCIECGSTLVTGLVFEDDRLIPEFEHPGCDGILRLKSGESRIAQPATYFLLSTEGNRIPT